MGRAGYCINHPGRPADNRCIQCHKPLCDDCVIHDEGDAFCSKKCLSRYRTFHRSYEEAAAKLDVGALLRRVGTGLLIVGIVVLLLSVAGRMGWRPARPVYDLVRRIFLGG